MRKRLRNEARQRGWKIKSVDAHGTLHILCKDSLAPDRRQAVEEDRKMRIEHMRDRLENPEILGRPVQVGTLFGVTELQLSICQLADALSTVGELRPQNVTRPFRQIRWSVEAAEKRGKRFARPLAGDDRDVDPLAWPDPVTTEFAPKLGVAPGTVRSHS